ncbi:MAG TPA: hypothetical protein VKU19_13060 [Bryobacteraceae bacterium]|nr:hypothetical protein [Bryobacteraceae bacterium]
MATTSTGPTISIDVTKDLESFSALKTMLSSQQGAIFSVVGELAKYAALPIQQAAKDKASAKLALSGSASWQTTNGIGFSLTPQASCSISVDVVSEAFPVAMSIESSQTTNIQAGPTAGIAYVNIDLDFSIQGSVSGSGTFSGLGVAGKASGSKSATLTFCQPVADTTLTLDAIRTAFSQLLFPLDPNCTQNMPTGAIGKVSFDGAINVELDVTYGLGDHKVSAPSLAKVQQSLQNVVQITPPSLDINAGAKGSVTYAHTDHFALIVDKTTAGTAMLYLVRASENDWGASVGITVGVKSTAASVTIDQTALQTVVGNVTGNNALAGEVVKAASQPLNNLQTSLNGKLNGWISDVTGQSGLMVSLGRQHGHTALFNFSVDLTSPVLATKSWSALVDGSVSAALALKGFTLQPGSGVSDSLKRSSTIQFQFFNLFSFKQSSDYFSNAYTALGADGTIRVFRDVGQEQQVATKKALAQYRIHFVAVATEDAVKNVSKAEVDMYIELSETGDSKKGATLSNTVGLIPANAAVQSAHSAMSTYVTSQPKGTLNLINIVKASGYQKLSYTPYNGKKPAPLPHPQDQNNWAEFQNATEVLMPSIAFVSKLSFDWWITFNRTCIDQVGSTIVPDRRQTGNPAAVPPSFFVPLGAPGPLVSYFLLASAGFMNLCEDLGILAASVAAVQTDDQWNDLLAFLTKLVTDDLYIDYAMPTAGALLSLCAAGGAGITATANVAPDSSSLTCTLTVA